MDVGLTRFETKTKHITLMDAPGHKDFIPSMITGAAQVFVKAVFHSRPYPCRGTISCGCFLVLVVWKWMLLLLLLFLFCVCCRLSPLPPSSSLLPPPSSLLPPLSLTLLLMLAFLDLVISLFSYVCQADVAILVVGASTGEFEAGFEAGGQTREHALLVRSLGVTQIIVAVNKLDNVSGVPLSDSRLSYRTHYML